MSQSHKSSRLIIKDAVYAVPFESTHFNFNEDAIGIQYGDIVKPTGTPVYTMRKIEGKFGGGIAVEEGITNLLPSPDMFSGWSLDTGVTIETSELNENIKQINISPPNSNVDWTDAIKGDITVTASTTYTVSFYTRGLAKPVLKLLTNIGVIYETVANGNISENGWNRNTCTFTTQAGATTLTVQFYLANATNYGKWTKVTMPQLEQKGFATSFIVGTRANGSLKYTNEVNRLEGTIAMWVNPSDISSGVHHYFYYGNADGNGGVANNEIEFHLSYNSILVAFYRTKDGASAEQGPSVGAGTISLSEWTHIAMSYKIGGNLNLYKNGILVGSTALGSILPTTYANTENLYIGSCANSTLRHANAIIDDVVIYKTQVSDEEIASWYHSGMPFYNPYDYRGYSY